MAGCFPVTGMEAAAARAAAGAGTAAAKELYRRWRPTLDWASLARTADGLADAVDQAEKQVQQELRAERGEGVFMPVRFTASAHPQVEEGIDSAEVNEIATFFDLLEQPRRLVVLGEPGSGKTVAATYLVRGLIQHRNELVATAQRAAEPVPVRVNAAGWDGGQEFSAWLATRLKVDYELPIAVAEKLVRAGKVLPVLDGIDEMDDDTTAGNRARALLDRLNEREWAHRPVVVLCRSAEFDYLARKGDDNGLHGAATVTLDPLDTGQPADYLTRFQHRVHAKHPAWDRIVTHLREHTDTPLAVTVRNPWMLGLSATVLHQIPQTALALLDCPTADAVRDGLFAGQIPAAIAGTDDTAKFRDYTSDNVEKWLRTLARHLEHRRDLGRNGTAIRLDEIWEIAGTNRIRLLHALAATLLGGLVFGLIFGIRDGRMAGLQVGVVGGLMVALAFIMFGFQMSSSASRIAWKVPTGARWPDGLRAGIMVGLLFGLMSGLFAGLRNGLRTGLGIGLMAGLGAGLMTGLMVGLKVTADEQLAVGTDARRLIRNDLEALLARSALFGLGIGFATGVAAGLRPGLGTGLLAVFIAGMVLGLVSGRYLLALLLFKITADFPARPAAFLNWARNSGLLRVNATAYQFRHQSYQQWLLRPN